MLELNFSSMAARLRRSEIRELLKLTLQPETISFGGGLPDPAIFPYEAVEKAAIRAIKERGDKALQYSPTEGDPFLKEQLAQFMQRHGDIVSPENLLVVSSSQQGLDLLAKVFIDPGDAVIVERPTYVGTIQAFRAFGADFQGVEMDEEGMIPEELERTLARLKRQGRRPKFIYIIPEFQNPSGQTLSLARRKQVLAIAAKYNLLIVEDSPYRELRFKGDMLPSLYSMDTDGRVLLMKTLSKVFSPGLRLGWMAGPQQVIEKMIQAKQGTDLCTSAFTSILAGYLLQDGYIDKQIVISKRLYAKKAARMLEALELYMPNDMGVRWSKPEGGMFLWLTLPDYVDTVEMVTDAIEARVAYVVGVGFYHDGSGRNSMRLNYSYPSEEQITQGIERISRLVRKRLRVGSREVESEVGAA